MSAAAAKAPAADQPTHLAVRATRAKFRRAGLAFTDRFRAIQLRDLTPIQVAMLDAEAARTPPMLEVRRVTTEQLEIIAADGGQENETEIPEVDRLRARVRWLEDEIAKLRGQLKTAIERGKLAPP
jgi:uncharacterized small protein (DUF1192 family)